MLDLTTGHPMLTKLTHTGYHHRVFLEPRAEVTQQDLEPQKRHSQHWTLRQGERKTLQLLPLSDIQSVPAPPIGLTFKQYSKLALDVEISSALLTFLMTYCQKLQILYINKKLTRKITLLHELQHFAKHFRN